MIEIKLEGFKEMDQALKEFPLKLQKKVIKDALKAGAKIVQQEAKSGAPVKTGILRKSIVVRAGKRTRARKDWIWREDEFVPGVNIPLSVVVGFKKEGWYGRLVETGTEPHEIKVKKKKVLAKAGKVFGTKVKHPGIKAQPFMGPAFERNISRIISIVGEKIALGMERLKSAGK